MSDRAPDAEILYRKGAELWAQRELDDAFAVLTEALAASTGAEDQWWFAASRALAQIAMESDDLDLAERHLRRLPGHGIGDAQQMALRARRAMLAGDEQMSAVETSAGVARLADDDAEDVGSLMNGAIALAWCGEVLVELGYGQEASRLAAEARRRTAKAGIDDAMLNAILALVEAESARLVGDVTAPERLAEVDTTLSRDLETLVTREHARRAWEDGDSDGAATLYDQAVEASHRSGYKSLARLITVERGSGPPIPKTDPEPVERWAERSFQQQLGAHRPYAVVLRLVMDEDADRFFELEQEVEAMLNRDPALGSVDGTGSDGEVWELFLDGDDPDALWAAIRPLVEAVGPPPGSQVEMRSGSETISMSVTPTAET